MNKIETLERRVRDIYEAKAPERADWVDFMYENHVFVVAANARALSKRFQVGNEYAVAAALLHDIADAVMSRFDPEHETHSLEMARTLLTESGYSEEEITLIVDDAITNHSCYPGHLPKMIEGKVVATADAMAHLGTDFYYFCQQQMKTHKTDAEFKAWVTEKLDRDFNVKIFWEEIREEMRPAYEAYKQVFGL